MMEVVVHRLTSLIGARNMDQVVVEDLMLEKAED